MLALGVTEGEAQHIAASAGDWIDADQATTNGGAEDGDYRNATTPYRTGDTMMTDAGEIAAVAGVTPAIRQRMKPWLCALPAHDLSPLNVNTLMPEQAPLLQMLLPGRLSPAQARAHLAARPVGGYGSVTRFWSAPTLSGVTPVGDAATQVGVSTRWFRLNTIVRIGDVTLASEALIDASGTTPARVVRRKWGPDA
jgi:general secretion pathway protein K